MRKHVTPVHPDASIPDPDRGGFLPPAGRTVTWTPHWAGMLMREEISVGDPQDAPAAEAKTPETADPETADPKTPGPDAPTDASDDGHNAPHPDA